MNTSPTLAKASARPVKYDRKGTKRDRDLWNRLVNSRFGSDRPVLSGPESIKAARKLYRHATSKTWTGPTALTSGNRITWIRSGVLTVNPNWSRGNGGLREIIHAISHYAHRRLHPNDAPHSIRQARLEAKLAKFALRAGFLDGKLAAKPKAEKPKPEKPDPIRQRYQRMVNRRDKWAAELERSKRLLAKAEKERRAYERRHGERLKG